MHTRLSWDTCQSSDSALRGFFLWWTTQQWGRGGAFAGGQATGHMRTAPTAAQLNAISSINQEMKMGVNRLSRKLPLFINVMSGLVFAKCKK